MSRVSLSDFLEKAGAHHDVVSWATPYADDWSRAWQECPRPDWLLAIAARLGVARERLVLAAAAVARTALDAVPATEPRPLAAIEAAEAWARGETSREELAAKAQAADAVVAPDPACAAAAAAAWAAAESAVEPDLAAHAAANAVESHVLGAAECAMMSLLNYARRSGADRIREHIDAQTIVALASKE